MRQRTEEDKRFVRVALTGSTAGPSMYHLVEILGREKVLERLDRSL